MPKFFLPRRFKFYCPQGQDVHVFRAAGEHVVCETDGRHVLSANIVAIYSTDDNIVSLPPGAVVESRDDNA